MEIELPSKTQHIETAVEIPVRPVQRGQVVRLNLSQKSGATLHCVRGTLWITWLNSSQDTVLESGASIVVDLRDDILVEGLGGPASFAVLINAA